jgi:hypothetical protein
MAVVFVQSSDRRLCRTGARPTAIINDRLALDATIVRRLQEIGSNVLYNNGST